MREGRIRPSLGSHYKVAFSRGFVGGCEWRGSTVVWFGGVFTCQGATALVPYGDEGWAGLPV